MSKSATLASSKEYGPLVPWCDDTLGVCFVFLGRDIDELLPGKTYYLATWRSRARFDHVLCICNLGERNKLRDGGRDLSRLGQCKQILQIALEELRLLAEGIPQLEGGSAVHEVLGLDRCPQCRGGETTDHGGPLGVEQGCHTDANQTALRAQSCVRGYEVVNTYAIDDGVHLALDLGEPLLAGKGEGDGAHRTQV